MRSGSSLWPAPLAGLAALALYAFTLAPGLTWAHDGADGGDLLAAALVRGVPHPPGYPSYQLLLRLAITLAGPGSDPARTGNWLSAISAALAVALLADLIRRSLASPRSPLARTPGAAPGAVALVAALAWAASPALWSQAVITEVYALHALACVAVLWLVWRWRAAALDQATGALPRPTWLAVAGLIFGLGLGNHLSLVLLLPGMAAWLWPDRRCLRMPAGAGLAAALAAAGLCVYLYLPLAAAGRPAVDWGAPATPQGLLWVISARPYSGLAFGLPASYLPARLAAWAGEALRQFWPWGALLAGFGLWRLDRADHGWWRGSLLIALAFSLYALAYNSADSYVYLIPAWAMAALWLAWGLAVVIERATPAIERRRTTRQAWAAGLVVCLGLLALPLASTAANFQRMNLGDDRAAQDYVEAVLSSAQPGGIVLVASDGPTFALWYAVYGLHRRADLLPLNVNLYAYDWYREQIARQRPSLAPVLSGRPALPALIAQLAGTMPVYRAEPLPVTTTGLVEQPAGRLVRLLPRR